MSKFLKAAVVMLIGAIVLSNLTGCLAFLAQGAQEYARDAARMAEQAQRIAEQCPAAKKAADAALAAAVAASEAAGDARDAQRQSEAFADINAIITEMDNAGDAAADAKRQLDGAVGRVRQARINLFKANQRVWEMTAAAAGTAIVIGPFVGVAVGIAIDNANSARDELRDRVEEGALRARTAIQATSTLLKKVTDAAGGFARALDRNPENAGWRSLLDDARDQLNKAVAAAQQASDLVADDPDEAAARLKDAAAQVQSAQNNLSEMRRIIRRNFAGNKTMEEFSQELGEYLHRSEQNAKSAWQRARDALAAAKQACPGVSGGAAPPGGEGNTPQSPGDRTNEPPGGDYTPPPPPPPPDPGGDC